MASRKEQKEAARQRRLAEEQAAAQKQQRTRRMQLLGGGIVGAIVIVVVLIVVSTSGGSKAATKIPPRSPEAKSIATQVNASLKGIPQSGNVLGSPKAPVTMTEFGDLECPICRDFALGAETQLIAHEVKQGQVKIVYRSFETASNDPDAVPNVFPVQQSAAYAAGAQQKAWNFILLFYHEQQTENTPYVTASFLTGLASQVDGLNVKKWSGDRFNPKYSGEVLNDNTQAQKLLLQGTPSLSFSGPKSQTKYFDGALSYSQVQAAIKEVS